MGTRGVDVEREALDNVADEVDRVRLRVLLVDAQCADPSGIVDRRVLEAPDLAALGIFEMQEFYVDLHVVSGDLPLVTHARQRALVLARRQPVDAVPCHNVVEVVAGDREAVVAAQVPGGARRPEVVRKPLVDGLLLRSASACATNGSPGKAYGLIRPASHRCSNARRQL